jgi:hypothetical protein
LRVGEHSPGRKLWRRRIFLPTALVAFVLVLVGSASTGARPLSSGTTPAAKANPSAATAPIRPAHGKPFVPRLGDWEGTVNGFPASFALLSVPRFQAQFGRPPYGFTDVVLLRPATCPARPALHTEETITGPGAGMIRRSGSFLLQRFSFSGSLQGARSALLMGSFAGGHCSGRLIWHMHPADRAIVPDGTWKAHFSDGESSTFSVVAGGRLASHVVVPTGLHGCGAPTGAVDLFIGARGNAAIQTKGLSAGLHFSSGSATGRLSVPGASCSQPSLTMTATPR